MPAFFNLLRPVFRSFLRSSALPVCGLAFAIGLCPLSAQPLLPNSPPPASGRPLGSSPGLPPASLPPSPTPGAAGSGPDIHGLHDLVPLTFWERHRLHIVLGGSAVIVVLGVAIALLLRKKPQPPLTAIQRARQDLAAAHALLVTGQDKPFAIAVSSAVRHYLENAYDMPAPERTTEEFLQEAARHNWLKGELTALLRRFLGLCDLAKFAGQQFGAAEREQLLATATEFVEAADLRLHPPSASDQKTSPAVGGGPAAKPASP
jgi:hypothetical protein